MANNGNVGCTGIGNPRLGSTVRLDLRRQIASPTALHSQYAVQSGVHAPSRWASRLAIAFFWYCCSYPLTGAQLDHSEHNICYQQAYNQPHNGDRAADETKQQCELTQDAVHSPTGQKSLVAQWLQPAHGSAEHLCPRLLLVLLLVSSLDAQSQHQSTTPVSRRTYAR